MLTTDAWSLPTFTDSLLAPGLSCQAGPELTEEHSMESKWGPVAKMPPRAVCLLRTQPPHRKGQPQALILEREKKVWTPELQAAGGAQKSFIYGWRWSHLRT